MRIITQSLIIAFSLVLFACKKNEPPTYLEPYTSVTYDTYDGGVQEIFKVQDYLYIVLEEGNRVLKTDLEGNLIKALPTTGNSGVTKSMFFENGNRVDYSSAYFAVYDDDNTYVNSSQIPIAPGPPFSIYDYGMCKKGENIVLYLVVQINDKHTMQFIEIDNKGNSVSSNGVVLEEEYLENYKITNFSENNNQINVVAIRPGEDYNGSVACFITLDENLKEIHRDCKTDTYAHWYYIEHSPGGFQLKDGTFGTFYTSYIYNYGRTILSMNSSRQFSSGNLQTNYEMYKLNFLKNRNDLIGTASYEYRYSDAIIRYDRNGTYSETIVKETNVYSANGFIEDDQYYYVAGKNAENYWGQGVHPKLVLFKK